MLYTNPPPPFCSLGPRGPFASPNSEVSCQPQDPFTGGKNVGKSLMERNKKKTYNVSAEVTLQHIMQCGLREID